MTRPQTSKRHLLLASCIGTSIEWYDYYIFGTAAALVFGTQFYPQGDATAGTIAALMTFAVGFVMRPVGAAVIGHYGDRIGRKSMLVLTLLMTGLSTFLIGLLPTYAAIGIGAPLMLLALRLAQGFGVGGEWGGAVLVATEHATDKDRAFYGSFAQFGVPIGVLTSSLAFIAVGGLSDEDFMSWGWRIPFLLSFLLLIVGFLVRSRLTESPEFQKIKEQHKVTKLPIGTLFRERPGTMVLASLAAISPPLIGYTVIVYMLNYGTTAAGFERAPLQWLILASTIPWIGGIYYAARIADRVGAGLVYTIGCVAAVLWGFPLFWLVDTGNMVAALLAFCVAGVVQAIMAGAQGRWFSDIFDARVRYSGASIAYQMGGMIGGAITPIAAVALFASYKTSAAVATYITIIALICLVASFFLRTVAEKESAAVAAVAD